MKDLGQSRAVVLLGFVALIAALFLALRSTTVTIDLAAMNTDALRKYFASDALRQSSDDLTKMARLYAVTGDPQYRGHFDEILAIRNGEVQRPTFYAEIAYWDFVLAGEEPPERTGEPLTFAEFIEDRMTPGEPVPFRALLSDLAPAEQALLWISEEESNHLVVIENEAMDAIAAQIEAAAGEYVIEGAALEALQRLHGDEYHRDKATIMRPLVAINRVAEETSETLLPVWKAAFWDHQLFLGLGVLSLLLFAGGTWQQRFIFRKHARPVLLLALVTLLLAVVLAAPYVLWGFNEGAATEVGFRKYFAADGLRQSSDDLTRMVRLYAITGDPLYREYFDEILAIRNGEAGRPEAYDRVPYWDLVLATGERPTAAGAPVSLRTYLRDLAQDLGIAHPFSDEELALLEQAEDESNILAALENEVMNVVAAQVGAGGGEYVLEGAALDAMLRLHGDEYFRDKARIMRPLVDFAELSRLYLEDITVTFRASFSMALLSMGLGALSFLLFAGGFWLQRRGGK